MKKLTRCNVYDHSDSPDIHVAFKNCRRTANALRTQIQMDRGQATITAIRRSNPKRQRFMVLLTNLSFSRLTRHLLVFFENYDAIELSEGRRCIISDADGYRREMHLEDLLSTITD